jgi:type I restriction-modification system DNA methylase subunit
MIDLLTPLKQPYEAIYQSLNDVRELFHKRGRIADANAKLDETIKLMAIHYARLHSHLDVSFYKPLERRQTFTIEGLNLALEIVATKPPFVDAEGRSIFGVSPNVAFEQGEEDLAFELFRSAAIAISVQAQATDPLDVINEAFGHHVRDNFRSNTEDAQYMTPPEVVDLMIGMARKLIFQDTSDRNIVVIDPSCGVGSFLVAWHRVHEQERLRNPTLRDPVVVGQDKVDRMARLARANLIFSGFDTDKIFVGSSLEDGTPLSKYDGTADLILTNPPFGARFSVDEIKQTASNSLPQLSQGPAGKVFDSELVFIERYLTLLRPGGVCFAVVPDGVISGKGAPALIRQMIARGAELLAVIELPAVTFAQAGTRTKTAILAFRKIEKPSFEQDVFFAEAQKLGFEVSKRKGVTLKRANGESELPAILDAFLTRSQIDILGDDGGFAEWHKLDVSKSKAWTPRRFRTLVDTSDGLPENIEFISRPLAELVRPRRKTRPQSYVPGSLFISVLHVIGEGVLDLPSVLGYRPITPGLPVKPGAVIISRLNPRIPRVLVVPDLGGPMLCSSEFEILEPLDGVSPYALAFLLLSGPAQDQIRSFTAGTSASHSRVHPDAIRSIEIPWPEPQQAAFDKLIMNYEIANRGIIESISSISKLRIR